MFRTVFCRLDAGKRLLGLRALSPQLAVETRTLLSADPRDIWTFCAEKNAVEPVLSSVYAHAGLAEVLKLRAQMPRDMKSMMKASQDVMRPWFNPGLLQLHRVEIGDPLLPFLAKTDAVLPRYDDATDPAFLERFGPRRRCFALMHPSLDKPLCYVYAALVNEIPAAYSDIAKTSADANVLVFYAITNPLGGLGGLDLGNVLIKKAAGHMLETHGSDLTLVTLSPMPLFRRWLGDTPPSEKKAVEYLVAKACPVANFHLRNGASVMRVNPNADPSETGMTRSHGFMLNYLYTVDKIERNHRRYIDESHISMSDAVRDLI